MASLADIVFDCAHPPSLARFWAAVLDPTVLVEPASGGPRLWFQQVPEPKATKNRVHLDVRADDRRREVDRLRALGASVLDDQADVELGNARRTLRGRVLGR